MYLHQTPRLLQKLLPTLTWRNPSDRSVYLTFDDGPIPEVTPRVLEILSHYQAKATFFCVGDNINKYPLVFKEVIDHGHRIGNHTQHHINGWQTTSTAYQREVQQCQQTIDTHYSTTEKPLFRPPYGRLKPAQWRQLKRNYDIVMWDVLSADYKEDLSPKVCLRKTIQYTRPGSIVVFHDSLKSWKRLGFVLPRFLHYFSSKGYTFDTL